MSNHGNFKIDGPVPNLYPSCGRMHEICNLQSSAQMEECASRLRPKPFKPRRMELPCLLVAAAVIALAGASAAASDGAIVRAIEQRATCITHEGGDLPAPGTSGANGLPQSLRAQAACSASELDGTVCDALDTPQAAACLAREIAVWDGTLDRLLRDAVGTHRAAPTKGAVAAFRTYRDRTCAAYRAVAVNPGGQDIVMACRLGETARFAQKLYDAVFSP